MLNVNPAIPSGLGLAILRAGAATIGDAAGSIGTLNIGIGAFTVDGSDAAVTELIVGNDGTGTMNITNGAELNVTGFNSRATLGNHANGVGAVTVSGPGSTWSNQNELWVGGAGSGTLIVRNGGRLRCTSSAGFSNIIGTLPGASGAATIDGPGSMWTYSNSLLVGNEGDGTLTITNGGSLINNVSALSQIGSDGTGTAAVTGPGSTWDTNGSLLVGGSGAATLEVRNGGTLTSGNGVIRGLNAGSGQVLVADAGSTWTVMNGTLTIGLPEPGFTTGPTRLTLAEGGAVNVDGDIDLDTNALLQLHGGTLSAHEIGLGGLQFEGQFDWTSGTLHVNIFRKSLANQGGSLRREP